MTVQKSPSKADGSSRYGIPSREVRAQGMSRTHVMKIWVEPYWAVRKGAKKAELRTDDRDVQAGVESEQSGVKLA